MGFAPQLPLEAAIAEAGGFAERAAGRGRGACVLAALPAAIRAGKITPVDRFARARIDEALDGLERLIAASTTPATPYRAVPRPERAPRYSDYTHLARVKEWSLGGGEDE